ncbi:hypothetical protein D3C71_2163460 [compost metagenome]
MAIEYLNLNIRLHASISGCDCSRSGLHSCDDAVSCNGRHFIVGRFVGDTLVDVANDTIGVSCFKRCLVGVTFD